MALLLSQLLADAQLTDCQLTGDAEMSAITSDSRRCEKGCCFVAVCGPDVDGHNYIDAAIAAGATSIICERGDAVNGSGVAVAVLKDTAATLGTLAQCYYGWPSRQLKLIGITGTKGKTTVSYICRHILSAAGHKCGLIGTIECDTLAGRRDSANTTPGAVDIAAMMAEMLAAGATAAVMEVSSHGLDQGRCCGLDFDAGVFTNLHSEHMDYHQTMEKYFDAKAILFRQLRSSAAAVINVDDKWAARMADATNGRVISYSIDSAGDFTAENCSVSAAGSRFTLKAGDFSAEINLSLIGRHNIYNALAAAASCSALGVDISTIADALNSPMAVAGRLQRVDFDGDFSVFVDYAHTDDSLFNVLQSLRPLCKGRLIVLFGCGGDRDRTKRPRMAAVARQLADVLVITNDNPRTEDPQRILDEIVAGLDDYPCQSVHVQPDRQKAIQEALAMAAGGDIVLLAGKGHETYQILGTRKIHFDDAEIAAQLLAERFDSQSDDRRWRDNN